MTFSPSPRLVQMIVVTASFVFFSAPSSLASRPTVESNFHRVNEAIKGIATDFGPIRELYTPDAQIKFCWDVHGGNRRKCFEGNVDDVQLPFHQALTYFTTDINVEGDDATPTDMTLRWSNHMETKLGCIEETSGMAILKFNDEGKVISHHAVSADPIRCVPAYHESMSSSSSSSSLSAQSEEVSKYDQFVHAYEVFDTDFGPIREMYAPDAFVKFCWGGENPECSEGTVDEILLPIYEAIQNFNVKFEAITGKNNTEVMSMRWNDYLETKHDCDEVATGIAVVEFNEDGKVSRHYSLSDNAVHCVRDYHTIMAEATTINK